MQGVATPALSFNIYKKKRKKSISLNWLAFFIIKTKQDISCKKEKEMFKFIKNFFKNVEEKTLSELDREIIALLNKIEPRKCYTNTNERRFSAFSTSIQTVSGEKVNISVRLWEFFIYIEYGTQEIRLETEEHKAVYHRAQKIYDEVFVLCLEKKERKLVKTLQADFLG